MNVMFYEIEIKEKQVKVLLTFQDHSFQPLEGEALLQNYLLEMPMQVRGKLCCTENPRHFSSNDLRTK
jgi:hypothetical protein